MEKLRKIPKKNDEKNARIKFKTKKKIRKKNHEKFNKNSGKKL